MNKDWIRKTLAREFRGHGVQVEWVDESRPWLCKLRMGAQTFEGTVWTTADLSRRINGMAKVEAEGRAA